MLHGQAVQVSDSLYDATLLDVNAEGREGAFAANETFFTQEKDPDSCELLFPLFQEFNGFPSVLYPDKKIPRTLFKNWYIFRITSFSFGFFKRVLIMRICFHP